MCTSFMYCSVTVVILQAMLEDKMREADWELTQEAMDEQVARESYIQWLRDQEKRAKTTPVRTPELE